MRARWPVLLLLAAILLVALLAAVAVPQLLRVPASTASPPTEGWQAGTPEEQGLDSRRLAEGLQTLADRGTPFHTLLIIRNGKVIFDASRYPYSSSRLHNLASVTKSVMTTLIAMAAEQGKVDLDAPMLFYFPDRTIANLDARKQAITVRDLTGMVNGFQSGCMGGDESTLDAMRTQPDWIQAALDRPMVREPGTHFCYDSPGMHLLSGILQNATGMTALDFAREQLFTPLGISDMAWQADPQGYSHGWGDLSLTPSDAAKLGYLWLNGGVWDGKQIVPASWVRDSVAVQVEASPDDYGFGWWVSADSFYAMGRGGQTIKVMPALEAVVVTTGAGLEYDDVAAMIAQAFVEPGAPLPSNPEGLAMLGSTMAEIGEGPPPQPVAPLPGIASAISGTTYAFGPNKLGVERVSFRFDESDVASLHLLRAGRSDETRPIGLDGLYRFHNADAACRGWWADESTFHLEVLEFTETRGAPIDYELHFEADRLTLVSASLGLEIEGQQLDP